MKLLQQMMEEKATIQQILKILAKSFIDLGEKIDIVNSNLEDIKQILNNNNDRISFIKSDKISSSVISPDNMDKINHLIDDHNFIPSFGDDTMSIISKKKKMTMKKDFVSKAKSLKENEYE